VFYSLKTYLLNRPYTSVRTVELEVELMTIRTKSLELFALLSQS